MASINFPDPSTNNPNTGVPWADGDTFTTTQDGLQLTYIFKKPASPNTSSWWKAAGVLNNNPNNRIAQLNSSVEVTDTGSDGNVLITTDGTARAKFRTDGHLAIGGNVDASPRIELDSDGRIDINRSSDAGWFAQWSDTSNMRFGVATDGVVIMRNNSDENEVVLSPSGDARFNNNVRIGNGVATTNANTANITLNASGNASFTGNVISGSGDPQSGANNATKLTDGTVVATREGSQAIWVGFNNGNTTATSQISADGNADFSRIRARRANDTDAGLVVRDAAGNNEHIFYGSGDASFNQGSITFSAGGSASFTNTVSLTNGGAGIKFPAANTGNTNPNTLDDYEEGAWTPAVNRVSSPPTATYNSQQGTYVKVGCQVTVWGYMNVNSISSGAGDFTISGLPFTTSNVSGKNVSGGQAPLNIGRVTNMSMSTAGSGDRLGLLGETGNNTKFIYMYVMLRDSSGILQRGALTGWSNDSSIRFMCTYTTEE